MDTRHPGAARTEAERHVTDLYQAHALSLARLVLLMLGDSAAAQDVVQDAFLGLYRRLDKLADTGAAPAYLRTSVLNGCRTALKQRSRVPFQTASELLESAEAALIHTEEQRAVLAAARRLPARQREVLVLRYYLDMSEDQAAQATGGSRGTAKSATSRAVAAVGRMVMSQLEEDIRDSLRSEADRLREVRPLHLPPAAAHHGLRSARRAPRARW